MRYYLGYAGIPNDFFNLVSRHASNIVLESGEFFGFPVPGSAPVYSKDYAQRFERKFVEQLERRNEDVLRRLGFGVVYIESGSEVVDRLLTDTLFPSVLTAHVQWTPMRGSLTMQRASANELTSKLRNATARLKSALDVVFDEMVQRANRTPLLLPVQNFHSNVLKEALRDLQVTLVDQPEYKAGIGSAVERIRREHPVGRDEVSKLTRHVDRRSVAFTAPGNARHGFARRGGDHQPSCLLNGRRRLGVAYEHAFHYDCSPERGGALRGSFFGCHAGASDWKGDPHLNISPNDHVRG